MLTFFQFQRLSRQIHAHCVPTPTERELAKVRAVVAMCSRLSRTSAVNDGRIRGEFRLTLGAATAIAAAAAIRAMRVTGVPQVDGILFAATQITYLCHQTLRRNGEFGSFRIHARRVVGNTTTRATVLATRPLLNVHLSSFAMMLILRTRVRSIASSDHVPLVDICSFWAPRNSGREIGTPSGHSCLLGKCDKSGQPVPAVRLPRTERKPIGQENLGAINQLPREMNSFHHSRPLTLISCRSKRFSHVQHIKRDYHNLNDFRITARA